ncbi:putative SWI/SNF-related matrix-associated actin-dependent regulator of chromatin subfamily A member 3-like 1 [Selaginella moellendorffii]|uniref:putative SWI/SNF-related matrix-associated actin-dependent regulator of chromatin subfamily A member 3-like 1 n=1 Tax=Selaginella moellendorffii TaxID=88036 RepID=UPI000D1C8DB7|nr:putative SWI/SNF-related matrix-associated actin-dependent regulator of chromatin subfamily A member 3-like 1 [Selaginella moellendorffii]|eukprot:XP_024518098.1 putative SWI/SNF-related matrix-associated actin-dependent regulator of chromatin subfamily A member 3-like 1 [Selaginella moellendorffii]
MASAMAVDFSAAADEEDAINEPILVGSLMAEVRGLAHHRGKLSGDGLAQLVRDPTNRFDTNAFRVINERGEQVGYIQKEKAKSLAPLVDKGLAQLQCIGAGSGSSNRVSCEVFVFSLPAMVDAVRDHLEYYGEQLRSPYDPPVDNVDDGRGGGGSDQRVANGSSSRGGGGSDQRVANGASSSRASTSSSSRASTRRDYRDHHQQHQRPPRDQHHRVDRSLSVAAPPPARRKLMMTPPPPPPPPPQAPKAPSIDDIFESMTAGAKIRQRMEADNSVIKSSLMQHQKEALAWMVQRENSSALPPFWEKKGTTMYTNTLTNVTSAKRPESLRGGILADDMGLGKTLTVLALIATNKPGAVLPPIEDIKEPEQSQGGEPASKKLKTSDDKGKAKTAAPVPVSNDGPPCVPAADGPRGTLVICPLSVLSNWESQLKDHTYPAGLKVHKYHGPNRTANARILADYDIVFTTYNMLTERNSPLKKVHWLRLVLDEAHIIKNPRAQQTKSAVALNADRRWAVTGTPIQNSAKDLLSLMQFLHFEPLNEQSFWTKTIQKPLTSGEPVGFARLQGLMSSISLRRTKETKVNGKKLVDLPPKIITVFPVDLSPEDRSLYDKMEKDGRNMIRRFLDNGTVTKNYAVVLQMILRLRQICDHTSMCPAEIVNMSTSSDTDTQGPKAASPELLKKMLATLGDDFDCPICLAPPSGAVITSCAHVFCRRCLEKALEDEDKQCPMCHEELSEDDIFSSGKPDEEEDEELSNKNDVEDDDDKIDVKGVKPSAKINALVSMLEKTRAKDPNIKSVVFSQFSTMLKLIEGPLQKAGFKFVKLEGGMSASKREENMEAFKSTRSGSPTVFLLSLKAAGVGLNLVTASNVFMMDPWWNPAVEEQAMDRVHRLGQTRDVHVFRLIATDSIEERLLQVQEKKRAYAQIALGKEASEQRKKKCVEEVKLLMKC